MSLIEGENQWVPHISHINIGTNTNTLARSHLVPTIAEAEAKAGDRAVVVLVNMRRAVTVMPVVVANGPVGEQRQKPCCSSWLTVQDCMAMSS